MINGQKMLHWRNKKPDPECDKLISALIDHGDGTATSIRLELNRASLSRNGLRWWQSPVEVLTFTENDISWWHPIADDDPKVL